MTSNLGNAQIQFKSIRTEQTLLFHFSEKALTFDVLGSEFDVEMDSMFSLLYF